MEQARTDEEKPERVCCDCRHVFKDIGVFPGETGLSLFWCCAHPDYSEEWIESEHVGEAKWAQECPHFEEEKR